MLPYQIGQVLVFFGGELASYKVAQKPVINGIKKTPLIGGPLQNPRNIQVLQGGPKNQL